jgi:hypothetical protein
LGQKRYDAYREFFGKMMTYRHAVLKVSTSGYSADDIAAVDSLARAIWNGGLDAMNIISSENEPVWDAYYLAVRVAFDAVKDYDRRGEDRESIRRKVADADQALIVVQVELQKRLQAEIRGFGAD